MIDFLSIKCTVVHSNLRTNTAEPPSLVASLITALARRVESGKVFYLVRKFYIFSHLGVDQS